MLASPDEAAFRFNNRNNTYLFRDTLHRLSEGETPPFEELVIGADIASS